jgi:hypothetical protein
MKKKVTPKKVVSKIIKKLVIPLKIKKAVIPLKITVEVEAPVPGQEMRTSGKNL